MGEGFTRGPVRHLKPGLVRYSVIYKVYMGSAWKSYHMFVIQGVDREHKIAAELHARLATKHFPFNIVDVKNIGSEIPVDPSGEVVSDEHYARMKEAEMNENYDEIERRAKDLGIFVPDPKRIIH